MVIALREIQQQRKTLPEIGKQLIGGLRRLAFADKPKEEKAKEVLKSGGQMQPAPIPMRKSGSQEDAKTVIKEEKKKGR